MDKDKLKEVLRLHKLWLEGDEAGVRANLGGADLIGAGLRGADLSRANLSWANLAGANLSEANLIGANLSEADLSGADLMWANLSRADLRGANLSKADLDYSCWDLSCKTLQVKADANLVGQLLYHALILARNSNVNIDSLGDVIKLANLSSPVVKHVLKPY